MRVVEESTEIDGGSSHEHVVHAWDDATGLQAIIAIHSTALGPALGGTRFYPYPDDKAALRDVLRLSEGMTLKSAAAGLRLGGGKAVIVGDPDQMKTTDLLEAYGRFVDSFGGRYVTAEDVGTTVEDMVAVAHSTRWVTGLPLDMGGSGDPSGHTARGVLAAMRAAAAHLWDSTSLGGRRVAIQGVGKVGADLARLLVAAGSDVTIADIDDDTAHRLASEIDVELVAADEILRRDCDILAPCALGAVIGDHTLGELRCRAIVGSANNQLAPAFDPRQLSAAGVLYVPDFVANAGGIINIAVEFEADGYSESAADAAVDAIFDTVTDVLTDAARHNRTPAETAVARAERRVAAKG